VASVLVVKFKVFIIKYKNFFNVQEIIKFVKIRKSSNVKLLKSGVLCCQGGIKALRGPRPKIFNTYIYIYIYIYIRGNSHHSFPL